MRFALPLIVFSICTCVLRAELPPYVYVEMQEKADEFLKIEVLDASKEPVDKQSALTPFELKSKTQVFRIRVSANVLEVERSKSDLKDGDVISITYLRTERPAGTGWVGPSEIPILKKGEVTDAYLGKDPKSDSYSPAARGRSFQTIKE